MWTKRLMWIADVGFILYWTTIAFHLLPAGWLYAEHDNPLNLYLLIFPIPAL